MGLAEAIGDAVEHAVHAAHGLETKLDEEIIAAVRKRLHDSVGEFSGDPFKHARIAQVSFGESPQGKELGTHHNMAQDVIQETLLGIVDDLTAFATGVSKAADLVRHADGASAADLKAQHNLVTQLTTQSTHLHGDDAYNDGRNHRHYHPHYHPNGGK